MSKRNVEVCIFKQEHDGKYVEKLKGFGLQDVCKDSLITLTYLLLLQKILRI